jgi:hypothetical protein
MTLVIRFEAGLRPILKHQEHDQSSHGSWAKGSQGTTSNLSDDEIRDVIYNSKTVNEMFEKVANRLGKSMKPSVDNLSEDEITHYRGVSDVSRDAQRLLDGKIKFTEFQTWGQGIYLAEDKGIASNYGTLIGMKLDSSAKIVQGETTWDGAFDVSYENPSARTSNTTTSSFIDLRRIETQIRSEKMDNLSISDMRNIYWAGKGFDGFTTYGETVLFNGSKLTLNKADIGTAVQKHQDHDQKTHGNWATGGGDTAINKFENAANQAYGTGEEAFTIYYTGDNSVAALGEYLARGHTVNDNIRSSGDLDLGDGKTYADSSVVKGLDNAIEMAPRMPNQKVWRTASAEAIENLKVNGVYIDKGFTSTTAVDITHPDNGMLLLTLSTVSSGRKALMEIDTGSVGKGLYIPKMFPGQPIAEKEREFLLPRETKMRYLGSDFNISPSGKTIVEIHKFKVED